MNYDYNIFGAYYTITNVLNDPTSYFHGFPILYGSARLHHIKCASDIYYIRLAKDLNEQLFDIDVNGEILCDFFPLSVDTQVHALNYLATGSKTNLHPVTQQVISIDESKDFDKEQILSRRAGIMSLEFLGFTPAHVFMVRPELDGTDLVDTAQGPIEVKRFNAGSWYQIDNPEYL